MAAKGHPVPTLYANLMDEAKVRIGCIDKAVHGRTHMPAPLVREFCYLQLRILCELISLSCLVAHGDIAAKYSQRLGKEWSADKIMDQLTKLHPDFYPLPIKQFPGRVPIGNGNYQSAVEGVNPSPLPKTDLLELYGNTHRYLHRGNVKKILTSDTPIDMNPNFPEIIKCAQKLHDLLALHIIIINPNKLLFCMLRNSDDNNRVQAGFLEAKQPIRLTK